MARLLAAFQVVAVRAQPRVAAAEAAVVAAAVVRRQRQPVPWRELPTAIPTSAVFGISPSVLERQESKGLIRMHPHLLAVVAVGLLVVAVVLAVAAALPAVTRQQSLVARLLAVVLLVAELGVVGRAELPAEEPRVVQPREAVAVAQRILLSIPPMGAFPINRRPEPSRQTYW
jgi:hypothetical protein